MSLPEKMFGLVLKHDGFSGTQEGPVIESLEPYLEARELAVPEPGDGQVLLRLLRANINPSDLHFIKGEYGIPRRAGVPAGFEAVGEAVAAGKGAEHLMGQRLGFLASASGAWAEYAVADAATCIPVRPDVRDEDAATLFVNPLTAIGMFEEATKNGNDAFIMTAAASQLCKLITVLAEKEGKQAISIVRRDEHIEPLKALGAAHVLNMTSSRFKDDLTQLMATAKPRVLLDAVADQVSSDMFFAMPGRSRWIVYGKLSTEAPTLQQMGQFIFLQKQIEGFWLTPWIRAQPPAKQAEHAMKVQELFASGVWQTDVAETVHLRDAMEALPPALSKINTGKVMLVP